MAAASAIISSVRMNVAVAIPFEIVAFDYSHDCQNGNNSGHDFLLLARSFSFLWSLRGARHFSTLRGGGK